VHAMSGYLEFPPDRREETVAALGCIDYWWAEDVEHPDRFRFFECWTTVEEFDAHQAQPYEATFMEEHVSRVTGADAYVLDIAGRRSVLEG
jgi:quinol monooxygenase YgiN